MSPALDAVLPDLRCPVCGSSFVRVGAVVRCGRGHSYDRARAGYLNLLPGGARTGSADRPGMVSARVEFLAAGHYRPLADRLAGLAGLTDADGLVVDAGGGTGYYLARVLADGPGRGLVVDLSTAAARVAARAHPRMAAVVADVWAGLPVGDGVAEVVLSAFAPRNPEEFARVLQPGGRLVVAGAAEGHLAELAGPLGLLGVEPAKTDRLDRSLAGRFTLAGRSQWRSVLRLDRADARRLAAMGPAAFHVEPAEVAARAEALPAASSVTAAVTLSAYHLR